MARRKRRKGAGPPPVARPRKESVREQQAARAAAPPKRRPGEPVPPSFRGVMIRALIVAAIFYPYLVYVVGETPEAAIVVSLIALVLMIPLGMLLDRMRYRMQMRRWERRQAESQGR